MSNVTLDTLTRAEAHRKLLALGMSADVAADYLDSEASLTARLALSLACPGAWPILEAYQRHCKSKATDPLDTVPEEERERVWQGGWTSAMRDSVLTPVEEAEIIASAPAHIGPWTPESWNTCPKCKGPVEKSSGDVDFADGDEAKCTDCGTVLMVSIAEDGGPCSFYDASLVARAKRAEDALRRAGVSTIGAGPDIDRGWLAVVREVDASRPVPVAAAADRLASGHVQRLRDGTWEWCHDGGFDNGVVTFSPATNAWLSEVVKDANQPGLTGDVWASLVRAIATLAENDSLVDDAITATERAGCPADVVLHLREINDAMYRRRMRGQSGITWSTAIKAIIALAPHGDVTAQARTVRRIVGERQEITEEAIGALQDIAGAMRAQTKPTTGFTEEQTHNLTSEVEWLLESLESEEVGGWTLPSGAHAIVKVDGGHLSVVQAGQHRSWIVKVRELCATLRAFARTADVIEDRAYVDIRAERASQIAKGRIPEKDDARSDEDWHACLMGVLGALCNDTRRRWVKVGSVAVAAIQSLDRRAGHGEHDAKRGGQ